MIVKMLLEFCNERRGSGEAIGFAASALLLMLIVLSFYSPVRFAFQQLIMENVHRSALLEMEEEGGLTPQIKQRVIEWLESFGFAANKISVSSSTPYPVQHGEEIELTISYQTEYKTFFVSSLLLATESEPKTIEITRSSISREYFKGM